MSQDIKQLTPVDLSDVWETEPQHFTPWLAQEENLTRLGETLGIELELEAQEINVGRFRADLLCKNIVDDSWVLIENQLALTDHTHVGQLLTYAAGLDASTVIWIARTFQQEHRAMLDWQNRITDERYRFFGVEVKVWQIENSPYAIQFDVVSSPNDWSRGVSRYTERAIREDLSETDIQLERFWATLRDYMIQKESPVNCPKPYPGRFLIFSIGRTNFSMEGRIATKLKKIEVHLIVSGQNAKAHFYFLKQQQTEIQMEFGETLEWEESPGRKSSRISLRKEDTDPQDESDWPNQHNWLASKLELFDKVFRPRIKALNAADWVPSEDEADV